MTCPRCGSPNVEVLGSTGPRRVYVCRACARQFTEKVKH